MPDLILPKTPAPFSADLYPVFAKLIDEYARPRRGERVVRLLDVNAGVGGVHRLQDEKMTKVELETVGVELMPDWAVQHERTYCGDATNLTWLHIERGVPLGFDVHLTSPAYGNRFADHHVNKDKCTQCDGTGVQDSEHTKVELVCAKCRGTGLSPRRSYAHMYGRDKMLADADPEINACLMKWGPQYRATYESIWSEVHLWLRKGGINIVNVGDHYKTLTRGGESVRQHVSAWHRKTIMSLGFDLLRTRRVKLPGFRHGENFDSRVGFEYVYVFRKR